MKDDNERCIAELINGAEHTSASGASIPCSDLKPKLLIENTDPQRTIVALRDNLATEGTLFDRGVPVRLVTDHQTGIATARPITADALVMLAHTVTRPIIVKSKDGRADEHNARFPRPLAVAYLDWHGEWQLPPLNGIASTPLLRADGAITGVNGYDRLTGFWLENVVDISSLVLARPTRSDALAALQLLRATFATFCFADAAMVPKPSDASTVDLTSPPGHDETALLVALLTAVCRPSLDLAPGFLVRAPQLSGAGSGKGLLVRSICRIAFGREPHAVTGGSDLAELEKRIVAELIGGGPALFLDNLNNVTFRSNLLASAITERPARVRILGKSQMLPLNATVFIALTGNALSVSEDLARRFIAIELDPRMEDPETRYFATDMFQNAGERRAELLAAVLTIWRWGRHQSALPQGRPLGSFDQWSRWVRDPLLALGCRDPVERLVDAKQHDGHRQEIVEIFRLWEQLHGAKPVTAHALHPRIQLAIDPQKRGRQFVASQLAKLAGARVAGFTLSRQPSAGRWSPDTYCLHSDDPPAPHREHRHHRSESDDGDA